MKFGFIVSTETQFEFAEEIARGLRTEDPICELWLISRRRYQLGEEYDSSIVQRTFSRLVSPREPSALRRLMNRVSRLLAPNLAPQRWVQIPEKAYPQLFPGGEPIRFDFVFTLNDVSSIDLIRTFQSIHVPVGLVQESIRRDSFDKKGKLMNGQGGCDVVYAWGDSSVDYYRRVGVNPQRIVRAGNPRIDRFVCIASSLPSAREIKQEEGLPADKPLVLLATNRVYISNFVRPLPLADFLHCVSRVIDWCREIGASVLIKPHPHQLEDMSSWKVPVWIDSLPHVRYRPKIDLARAIKASDAVLVFNSSVAVEARALGKPSGILAARRYSHNVDYLERGISREIESRDDLLSLLSCRLDPRQDEKLAEYLVATNGSAQTIVQDVLRRCSGETYVVDELTVK